MRSDTTSGASAFTVGGGWACWPPLSGLWEDLDREGPVLACLSFLVSGRSLLFGLSGTYLAWKLILSPPSSMINPLFTHHSFCFFFSSDRSRIGRQPIPVLEASSYAARQFVSSPRAPRRWLQTPLPVQSVFDRGFPLRGVHSKPPQPPVNSLAGKFLVAVLLCA